MFIKHIKPMCFLGVMIMKQAIVLFILLLPFPVFAESMGGMSEAQMQQMMQQAQAMQACMQNVDQSESTVNKYISHIYTYTNK